MLPACDKQREKDACEQLRGYLRSKRVESSIGNLLPEYRLGQRYIPMNFSRR